MDWTTSNSVGASGGMVILWKKGSLELNHSFIGSGFVGINVVWKGSCINLVNIYAPCSARPRRDLRRSLLERRGRSINEEWCLGDDFNEVTGSVERLGEGGYFCRRGTEEFRDFIGRMGVVDIPCVGGKYTWFKNNGKAIIRLDRFLVSKNLIEVWGVMDQRIGMVEDVGSRKGDFVLFEKLQRLKVRLKESTREVFGWIDLKVDKEVGIINETDEMLVENFGGGIEGFVETRRKTTNEVWKTLSLKESMLRLKSRQLWLKDGDKSTRFFHNSLKKRYRKNAILVLEGRDGRVEGVEEVKEEVKNHFENFFKEEDFFRAVPKGLNLNCLNEEDREWLERVPLVEEIKEEVWDCDGNKSPGPDGFTLAFFQLCWETIKGDIVRFVKDFFHKARLTKGCTSSFLALIPKVKNPQSLSEFRPIFLVGYLYKIPAKLLASRLRRVIGKLVSSNQTAFVPGRNIADGVLFVNEVLDLAKREKRSCVVLKVDFEKAYDRVLMDLMRKAITIGDFHDFKINDVEEVSMLQFADDIIIIGEGDTSNLWRMKTILRGFEIMSGLRINFHKSNIYGINVGEGYLEAASTFLLCKVDSLPFKFLRVRVGDSPRKISMWRELILVSKNRLAVWKGVVTCKVGDRREVPFGYGCWADSQPLMVIFPELYRKSFIVRVEG
ncbi:uncharacterized protein LOC131631081 [Vicia villosa]|uniref:uncharacterized protein LOC131631081 n=1 Tax=Vicia villosa TaxID=3911 RepID=UPI00273CD864|nr:uncharacterized protein LOC131631081 [Vicia villosa]